MQDIIRYLTKIPKDDRMKKSKVPTKEEILAKKEELAKKAKETIEETKSGKRSSPITDFLNEIKEIIKEMIDNGVSYKKISKAIYDVYSFKVSEQTVRAFAHSTLGVPARKRSAVKPETATPTKPKSSSEIKEEAAKRNKEKTGKATL